MKKLFERFADEGALREAKEEGEIGARALTEQEREHYERMARYDWEQEFGRLLTFVANEPIYCEAQEKDEATGEPLYEINVRALVNKETKEYWENMAWFFGCSLSLFIDQCLQYGEEVARGMRRYCDRMGWTADEGRWMF